MGRERDTLILKGAPVRDAGIRRELTRILEEQSGAVPAE